MPPVDPARARLFRLYAVTGFTTTALFVMHRPLDLGLLAWIALVPLLVLGIRETRRAAFAVAYFSTFTTHVLGLSWIALVAPPGWITTCFLEGFYGIGAIAFARAARRRGLPLTLALPGFWVGLELIRGSLFPAIRFPWLFLGHTQHARTTLIQIVDVTSVYGLTFLLVAVNAFVADVVLFWLERRDEGKPVEPADARRLALLGLAPFSAIALALLYGAVRPSFVEKAIVDGPRVLAVQTDIKQSVKDAKESAADVADQNLRLTRNALAVAKANKETPDVIVWSETMWQWPLDTEWPDETKFKKYVTDVFNTYPPDIVPPGYGDVVLRKNRELFEIPTTWRIPLMVGAVDYGPLEADVKRHPVERVDPEALVKKCVDRGLLPRTALQASDPWQPLVEVFRPHADPGLKHAIADVALELRPMPPEHNSVFVIGADGRVDEKLRYDKTNLVPASEYIPGKGSLLFGWFYALIKTFVPDGFVTFEPGKGPVIIPIKDAAGEEWRFAPNLCFEVSFPELLAESVRRGADVHVCPSNDGWFERSAEIPLAYDQSIFRALESRRAVVRVVNRGITMFVDPLGNTTKAEGTDDQGRRDVLHVEATLNAHAKTTRLTTFYVRFGDLFAWVVFLASVALAIAAPRIRARTSGAVTV
jgi:apolipoprotein N-acyltransferase